MFTLHCINSILIILLMSICISVLLVWISIKMLKPYPHSQLWVSIPLLSFMGQYTLTVIYGSVYPYSHLWVSICLLSFMDQYTLTLIYGSVYPYSHLWVSIPLLSFMGQYNSVRLSAQNLSVLKAPRYAFKNLITSATTDHIQAQNFHFEYPLLCILYLQYTLFSLYFKFFILKFHSITACI